MKRINMTNMETNSWEEQFDEKVKEIVLGSNSDFGYLENLELDDLRGSTETVCRPDWDGVKAFIRELLKQQRDEKN